MINKKTDGNITTIWNDKNFKAADVIECLEYMLGQEKKFFRVDFNGVTVGISNNMSGALKIARGHLK